MQPPISKDQSPEKVAARMRATLELHRAGVRMMRTRIQREYPDESPEQRRQRLNAWLQAPSPHLRHTRAP